MHTLTKKTKQFLNYITIGGKTHFWGATEISGRWGGQRFQNLAGSQKNVGLAGIFNDFLFESKTKKLWYFKVGQFEIFEKHGFPFETNANVRNTFTWDV